MLQFNLACYPNYGVILCMSQQIVHDGHLFDVCSRNSSVRFLREARNPSCWLLFSSAAAEAASSARLVSPPLQYFLRFNYSN